MKPTGRILHYFLSRNGVVHGVDEAVLKDMVVTNRFNEPVVVARGTEPQNGEDGRIEYEIDISKNKRPELLANGGVDFRSIQTFTQVAQGQVIAKKIPPKPGVPGKAVTGLEIPAKPGQEYELTEGQNIGVSEDGLYLVVQKSGIIFEEGGILNITESLEIPSNVDFNVGNIKFTGHITIKGNVLPGFVVESEEDIEIQGEVESATIRSRNGRVTIHKGVIGKGKALVYGKKGVTLSFAQECEIETEGTLTVGRSLLHCSCFCRCFAVEQPDATFVGGELRAFEKVEAGVVGNEEEVETRIVLVDREREQVEKKYTELKALHEKLLEQIAPVKKQLATKAAILKKAGATISDRTKQELKKWIDAFNGLNKKVGYVEKKMEELADVLKKPNVSKGTVRIAGDAYPGVVLNFYGLTKRIKAKETNKRFVTQESGIAEG